MERAVERGLARREANSIRHVGLDEKSFGKGQSYVSVMTNLDEHCVLEVVEGRDRSSALALWDTLSAEQREGVVAVATDLSGSYISASQAAAPQAPIVPDKFHISKMLNGAVDEVRRDEHRKLQAEGDERLSKSRHLWLYDPANMRREQFFDFTSLLRVNFKTSRAWERKA